MAIEVWVGAIIALYGIWLIFRGSRSNSKPRIYNGFAVLFVGASIFFQAMPVIQIGLLALGVVLFMKSMRMLRQQIRGERR